jgi:hypothetical protein
MTPSTRDHFCRTYPIAYFQSSYRMYRWTSIANGRTFKRYDEWLAGCCTTTNRLYDYSTHRHSELRNLFPAPEPVYKIHVGSKTEASQDYTCTVVQKSRNPKRMQIDASRWWLFLGSNDTCGPILRKTISTVSWSRTSRDSHTSFALMPYP